MGFWCEISTNWIAVANIHHSTYLCECQWCHLWFGSVDHRRPPVLDHNAAFINTLYLQLSWSPNADFCTCQWDHISYNHCDVQLQWYDCDFRRCKRAKCHD